MSVMLIRRHRGVCLVLAEYEVSGDDISCDVRRTIDGGSVDLCCDEARERLLSRSLMSSTLWECHRAVDILVTSVQIELDSSMDRQP